MRAYLPHYPGLIAPRGLGSDPIDVPSGSSRKPQDADVASAFRRKTLTLGIPDAARRDVLERALDRARAAGAGAALLPPATPLAHLAGADVIVALEWPPSNGVPAAALHGIAAGRTVVVLEVEATAGWPALDPQTWQPRGYLDEPPIAISIDPRDEEHSLMLAIRRLAADPALRAALGAAAQAWWREHATLDHAVRAWERLLAEAARPPAARDARDGTERARAILGAMGVAVDFLESRIATRES
jgi:hypothetical protein